MGRTKIKLSFWVQVESLLASRTNGDGHEDLSTVPDGIETGGPFVHEKT